jgi:hypothetical protein
MIVVAEHADEHRRAVRRKQDGVKIEPEWCLESTRARFAVANGGTMAPSAILKPVCRQPLAAAWRYERSSVYLAVLPSFGLPVRNCSVI